MMHSYCAASKGPFIVQRSQGVTLIQMVKHYTGKRKYTGEPQFLE